jgi:hypothetical protein
MRGHRRVWLAVGSTVSGFVLVATAAQSAVAATATLVNEPFTGTTTSSPNWVAPAPSTGLVNDACLSASGALATSTPVPGCTTTAGTQPGLQLTTNALNQEGALAYSSSVPSSLGLDVTFTSYQYDTMNSPADGIAFFLAASDPNNASASPITLGQPGGYLGYSASPGGLPGLTNGYLGFGLDVYGNFTNSAYAGSGCTEGLLNTPNSVTVRGPGNGTAGYCLLSTHQSASGTLDSSTTPQPVPVEVAVNPTSTPETAAGGFPVPAGDYVLQVTEIGGSTVTETGPLPPDTGLPSGWVDTHGVPYQLTFGWSASTGASTDYHTISNVNVQTLNGTPPTLGVNLTDGGPARTGTTVTYNAAVTVSGSTETRPITLTDTFPADLVPQTAGLGGNGWTCGVSGPTVTCTYPPTPTSGTPTGPLPLAATVAMPVLVQVPAGAGSVSLTDNATAGAPDATQGTGTDVQTYSPAPTATVLGFITQPVDAQINTAMKNADSTTTHIQVGADVTPGGAIDTTYTGNVTLAFANNPGTAQFVVGGSPASSITVAAVNGVADFSPIIVNAVGFGYTLTASASGLTSATSNSFNVAAAATSCPSGQTCTVTTTSTVTGKSASIVAASGTGNAIITATFGGNVAPIHPCTGAASGILTFSGNRQKTITLTLPLKQAALVFCYGQPTPFLDILYRPVTYFSQANQEYEGLLPLCLPKFTGPCVKSISLTRTSEIVTFQSGAADPHIAD